MLWLELPFTKAELGFALGRGTCAMLALTDAGFASALVQKLAARDPEKYGPAAQQLREKADKALQRQRRSASTRRTCGRANGRPWARPPAGAGEPLRPQEAQGRPEALRPGPGHSRQAGGRSQRSARPAVSKAGPGGRKLSGKFRHHP